MYLNKRATGLVKLFILSPILISLFGCETRLSSVGSQVRDMSGQNVSGCSFIRVVEASEMWGNSVAGDRRSALNKLRNEVARVGDNAFVIDNFDSNALQSVVQAEALLC